MGLPQILLYLMIVIYFGSLGKIFEKAGRQSWEGYIPGYNIWVWLKVLNKPWWWLFFFLIPFVNFIIVVACNVETARLFGKYAVKDTLLTVLVPWYMIPALAFDKNALPTPPTDWSNKEDRMIRRWHDMLTLFFIAPFIGHALIILFKLTGSKDKPNKKTMAKEWTDALGFAIVAATIIRTLLFEAFTIPTGSMEKTMLIGDYLFVNKIKYGPKVAQTPMSVPFVHNVLPMSTTRSYVEWFQLDYFRLPGYGKIERGDITVFNWPAGDTVILEPELIAHTYQQILNDEALKLCIMELQQKGSSLLEKPGGLKLYMDKNDKKFLSMARQRIISGQPMVMASHGNLVARGIDSRPVDKKENYIKRCVGIAGDSLEVIDGLLYVNGVAEVQVPGVQYDYDFILNSQFDDMKLKELYDINLPKGLRYFNLHNGTLGVTLSCTKDVFAKIKNLPQVISANVNHKPKGYEYTEPRLFGKRPEEFGISSEYFMKYNPIFPKSAHADFNWSEDNYGPFYLPKEGDVIELNEHNFIFYRRAIEAYEGNRVEEKSDGYYINGSLAKSYTFKQNYYWLMGDNRDGSVDSRMWGYVPEDHVVGTAAFVWFSKDADLSGFGGIRWGRIFSLVE